VILQPYLAFRPLIGLVATEVTVYLQERSTFLIHVSPVFGPLLYTGREGRRQRGVLLLCCRAGWHLCRTTSSLHIRKAAHTPPRGVGATIFTCLGEINATVPIAHINLLAQGFPEALGGTAGFVIDDIGEILWQRCAKL